ncbi:MAG: hypothetical protein GY771_15285 [bacterium]|nr:hypothetical protein [bacterium]
MLFDIEKATNYVNESGGELERAFLGVLSGELMPVLFESIVRQYQLDEGSWFYRDDEARMPSIGASIYWMRFLIDARMQGTDTLDNTANFLAANQSNDGSWSELPLKLQYAPQPWLSGDEDTDRIFFTSGAAAALVGAGFIGSEALSSAVNYLEQAWAQMGKFPHYPHSVAAAIPAFAATRGQSSPIYQNVCKDVDANCGKYPPAALTYTLDMCRFAGFSTGENLVKKLVNTLGKKQRDDGGVDMPEENRALVTADAVNLMKWFTK